MRWLATLLGPRGERRAARYLKQQGLRILRRNLSDFGGEIDLVAMDGEWLVFVEVKTRKSREAGAPFEAVTREKQRRLTRAALRFLKRHGLLEQRARFDVVSVVWAEGAREPEIEHFRNAFEPVGDGQFFG